jgi:hypothetical protein
VQQRLQQFFWWFVKVVKKMLQYFKHDHLAKKVSAQQIHIWLQQNLRKLIPTYVASNQCMKHR